MSKLPVDIRNEGFGRPTGYFVPTPMTPRVEQGQKSQCEKNCDHEKQCTTSKPDYTQARPAHQPWDWPVVRKQIIAHDRAKSRSWNYWYEYLFESWADWTKDAYTMLRDLYLVMPFPAFVTHCCQLFFRALWRLLAPGVVRSIALVLWSVCMLVCIVVLSVVAFCFAIMDASWELLSVILELGMSDEVQAVMGSLLRGFLSCCIASWTLYGVLMGLWVSINACLLFAGKYM